MNCEQMRAMLDAYIDGELSQEEVRALRDHASTCTDCRNELMAAEQLRDALGHLDDDLCVPLEAQAAWRSAVHMEAAKKRQKRLMRAVYAVAAVLVVAIGCTAMLKSDIFAGKKANLPVEDAPIAARAMPDAGLIASDGNSDDAQAAKTAFTEDYTAWKKYGVADFERACDTLEVLAAEYSGTAVSDWTDSEAVQGAREAMYRIELPYEYVQDFLSAASLLGEEQDSEIRNDDGETAVVYIQVFEQNAE